MSARPSVLWCYKKELGFTSHRKKRETKIKRDVKRGIREPNEQSPFEIFVTVTDIRYTFVQSFLSINLLTELNIHLCSLDTTKNRIRFWEIHLACVCYKISKPLHLTCLLERLKPWREVD